MYYIHGPGVDEIKFLPFYTCDERWALHVVIKRKFFYIYILWYKNLNIAFFRFVTMHTFDRQTDRRTDGQTEFPSLYRDCIPCSAVKMHWLPIPAIELQACQVHVQDIVRITSNECQMMLRVDHKIGSSDIFTMCRATVQNSPGWQVGYCCELTCCCLILVCINGKRTALLIILCLTCLLVLWNVLALCRRLLLLEKVGLRW